MKALTRHELERLDPRNVRRQRLARHFHAAGPRPLLEALLDVAGGRDLDETLSDFARLNARTYEAVGASQLPIQKIEIIKGGRK